MPLVVPLFNAVYWPAMCVCAVALAPLACVDGLLNAARDLFGLVTGTRELPVAARAEHAIVVTGCDSGFGRALAPHLAEQGYTVFAACLTPAACTGLASVPNVQPLVMDVTSDAQVAAAAQAVATWLDADAPRRRLLSVVNNAGVGTGGFTELLQMKDFEFDAAVNYFGVVRTCKAFLPSLRRSVRASPGPSPRIVIVSSMSGKIPVPLLAPYTASKHAVMAFAGALRMELTMFGVHVVTALPSFHRSPLLMNRSPMIDRVWAAAPAEAKAAYTPVCNESAKRCCEEFLTDWAWDPHRVTEQLALCATSMRTPPCEVSVGSDARYGLNAMRHLPPAVYEAVCLWWMKWHLVEPVGK